LKRPWALPLVPLYWAGAGGKNALYDRGWLKVRSLQRPVVSIGSLSAGGAGKTPVVLMLADLLARQGLAVDVLSRGYGRGSGVVEEVDLAGPATRFGDEPLEMARRGLRVFVGAERYEAGKVAEATVEHSAVHLLDDGFQHRRLARSLDVVLLTQEDARDWLLPAGNLREPLASLRRADVVVVREEEAAALTPVIAARTTAEVWVIRRTLRLPEDMPERPMVFCGIARPEGFAAMLSDAGCRPAAMRTFPDHHPYCDGDFALLAEAARHGGADGFCTTAKDAVKIPEAAMRRLKEVGSIAVAELRVSLLDEGKAVERLRKIWT
jgi:tetraacyldisaccharide 4'-kinase